MSNKYQKLASFIMLAVLTATVLAGCGEDPTSTTSDRAVFVTSTPNRSVSTPLPGQSGGTTPQPTSAVNPPPAATVAPGSAKPGQPAGPLIGADGQITVIAPPATGENIQGQIFWAQDNNIWQGGAGAAGSPPVSAKNLGGKQLTKSTALAIAKSPAASPDGSKLIYAYSPEPEGTAGNIIIGQDIYAIDLKSNTNTLLIKRDEPQTFLDNPSWSADGKFVYFDSRTPKKDSKGQIVGEVYSINRLELATGKRQTLAEDAREPTPFADNKRVVFISVAASTGTYEQSLKVFDLETKQVKSLLDPGLGFLGTYMPRPSPDGQLIAFSGAGGPDNGANPGLPPAPTKSSLAGGTLGMIGLLPGTLGQRAPSVAPKAHGIPFDLWLIKPDGTGLKRLTTLYEDQPQPAWSKDSQKVALLAGQGFYTVDVTGKNLVKRSDKGGHGGFDWRS